MSGPFGGIQSELPQHVLGNLGFYDCRNIMFRSARADVRPGYTPLASIGESILAIADFFTVAGNRVQCVITPTKIKVWQSGTRTWSDVTGTLAGAPPRLFGWTVVNHKLLFSNGIDKVQLWDGITDTFAAASANAVPARYLAEIGTHLVVADTIEGGRCHQRTRWTRSGDPTDWTSYSAGVHDELGDLGPITGLCRISQIGYQFHWRGIVQIVPTGVALRPFDFRAITQNNRGNTAPYSLAVFGEQAAFYVGKDDIYMFDGTNSVPIGSRAMTSEYGIAGAARLGARARIFAELKVADLDKVYGFVSSSISGNAFNAYWLVIPGGGSVWVYNIEEGSWTRFAYDKAVDLVSTFSDFHAIRICDLVGTIADQNWTPAGLPVNGGMDSMLVGFSDGTPGLVDFTGYSESPWFIQSGRLAMNDTRHGKTVKKFRIVFYDLGPLSFTVRFRNERGQVHTESVSFAGTGSGDPVVRTVPVSLSGMFLDWRLDGDANSPSSFAEFTPVYDVSGEHRNA